MCIVEPYRPQPPCLVYSFGYHRCSFRPHRRHCKQCYEGPWFNSNLGALNSLCWPPRAKTGSPKCWEWRWGFEAQGPATGSGKRCKPPMPRVLTRGPPGAWGTSSLNRMNPRFLRHWWLPMLLAFAFSFQDLDFANGVTTHVPPVRWMSMNSLPSAYCSEHRLQSQPLMTLTTETRYMLISLCACQLLVIRSVSQFASLLSSCSP